MNPATGAIIDRWEIPAIDKVEKGNAEDGAQHSVRIPELLGMADSRLFFITADEGDRSEVAVYDTDSRSTNRFSIDIGQDELYFSTLFLSPRGHSLRPIGDKI